ncbi:uncharacterized protein K452DRAFT_288112 [Aplosporella prunicola CBS 121167]|uniref:DUF8035 domain-containing protein n=1 Tax=Aplosporella prunicola CBS 121167 TaxID=1176127 RepID=A0A6A6BDU2_9PEZI|nr:uncharacterized protein K452DRAFT_288112 [Aplosporella prunicola CBS 121167]KAF2141414.1 hypothetical protein K452DRAFT_288112 [Aplosporella prunicola CBS 121167]
MPFGYRSSTGALDRYDDYDDPPLRPERWDRDKFERMSRRPADERELFRVEERDTYGPRARRDVALEERFESRPPRSRFDERDRYPEEDRFDRRPGRRPDFLDREEPTPSEIANRALAPYRRKSVVDRDYSPPARRPPRPSMIRRQSSLDTFDRRPLRRYEAEREDWRPPANIDIPLPIRRRPSRERRRSPPRDRYGEEEFEEVRYRDTEPDYKEDYREVEIRREKRRPRRRRGDSHGGRSSARSESRYGAPSTRSESRYRAPSTRSSTSSFEEIREVSPVHLPGKRGKTRMPRRLVHRNALIQLGYPFEEEENFLIVKRALEKEQIDEVIKISETYKEENNRTTYRYDEEKTIDVPPPPETIVLAPPPPPSEHFVAAPPSAYRSAPSVRSASPRREFVEERLEESNHIGGPFTVVVPDRHQRSDREIKDEIRQLENERRALQLERQARDLRISDVEYREKDYEFVEERPRERNVVRIDKDRKARTRSRSKPPNPKLVAAMMSTLT